MIKLIKFKGSTLALLLAANAAGAGQLWDNGAADGSDTLEWGQYSSTMDDFYVPGGGWWIENAQTYGIYLNAGTEVTEVEVAIWPHDMDTDAPDGATAYPLNVVDFEAVATGNTYFGGYQEIKINVEFDKTYLQGQEFYWIEFTVRDQFGHTDFHFLARQDVSHDPARIHFGGGSTEPNNGEADLAYALYGSEVKTISSGVTGSFKLGTISEGKAAHTLYLAQGSGGYTERFRPGLYQMEVVKGEPRLFIFDPAGSRSELDFASSSRRPLQFHTPLGDYMCAKAPDLIQEFCQTFVACAAYDLFCY